MYSGRTSHYEINQNEYHMQPMYSLEQFSNIQYVSNQAPVPQLPQGMSGQWMQRPAPIQNCPIGLEYLLQLDKIHVEQLASLTEALTGWEKNNKYALRNSNGQQIFYTFEDTDACQRQCCGPQRRFLLHVVDSLNNEVMRISRDFKCCAGCCWCAGCCECCSHEVTVEAVNGEILGYIKQLGSCWKVQYDILDEMRNPVLHIQGPCCICDGACCTCTNEFLIVSNDGHEVGKICKEYSGFIKELFTNADNFTINFPIDLNVRTKATLLGALFLIVKIKFKLLYPVLLLGSFPAYFKDFMFFEQTQDNNKDSNN